MEKLTNDELMVLLNLVNQAIERSWAEKADSQLVHTSEMAGMVIGTFRCDGVTLVKKLLKEGQDRKIFKRPACAGGEA